MAVYSLFHACVSVRALGSGVCAYATFSVIPPAQPSMLQRKCGAEFSCRWLFLYALRVRARVMHISAFFGAESIVALPCWCTLVAMIVFCTCVQREVTTVSKPCAASNIIPVADFL